MSSEPTVSLGFTFRERKSGDVEVLRRGQLVSLLRGAAALNFLASIQSCDTAEGQQLMARLTGNYKRGNERHASAHPRNRRR